MTGVLRLALQRVRYDRLRTWILAACIAVPIFIPVAAHVVTARFEAQLTRRADTTPLVLGARGNRFDLTLTALWFRAGELSVLPFSELEALNDHRSGVAIPLHVRFRARGRPVVGTSPEYFERRQLHAVRGGLPVRLGECVLGATAAQALHLGPGDTLFSDQREVYDIAKPPALKMHVCGVLGRRGTPDDDVVFVDVKTTWILEGLAHGHDAPERIDPALVLGRTGKGRVLLSGALIEYNEVTPANAASFHYHVDSSHLPLSAVLFYPATAKAGTMEKARVNASKTYQMLAPSEVVQELLAFVLRVRALLDGLAFVLAACTALMTILVIVLSVRMRAREMETLHHIGCSRFAVIKLHAAEVALVVAGSIVLAGAGVLLTRLVFPDVAWFF